MAKYQFTLFSTTGKYKPVSCMIEAENRMSLMQGGKDYTRAIQKIMQKRNWKVADIKLFGYTQFKIRKIVED